MDVLEKAVAGERLSEAEVLSLFDLPLPELAAAAHEVRLKKTDPEVVTFLIDRNINYTNVCTVACAFCAFYRTKRQKDAYTLSYEEIARKVEELYQVGGRRILMQGGVNPELPLVWYLDLLRYLKSRFPDLRIDAFSPEEILGLERLTGLRAEAILEKLKEAGLDGLPGAGAEILVDEVRLKAAPARIRTADWYRIVDAAQALGLYTLATMVIGFGEGPKERTAHLLGLRAQQDRALERYENGFAAFALWTLQVEHTRLKGKAPGATAHEYLKTLAVARLAWTTSPTSRPPGPPWASRWPRRPSTTEPTTSGAPCWRRTWSRPREGTGAPTPRCARSCATSWTRGLSRRNGTPSTASSATPTPRPSSASPSPWSSPSPKGSSPSGRGRSRCRPRPGRDRLPAGHRSRSSRASP